MKASMPMGGSNLAGRYNLFGKRLVPGVAVLLILSMIVYLVWHHFSTQNSTPNFIKKATAPTVQAAQNSLRTGDYEAYQAFETGVAQSYLTNNDTKDAEKTMEEVFAKVPAAKIDDLSLTMMIRVQDTKRDRAKEKYYDQLYIKYLQARGDAAAAQQIQKEMDALK